MLINFAAPVDLRAAAAAEEGKRPTFAIAAYTGAPMGSVPGFYTPVIVDLSGLTATRQKLPILLDHDATRIVGMANEVKIDASGVHLAGTITGDDGDAQKVVMHAKNGFEWQASIGARVTRREFLEAGKRAVVNAREVTGPIMIARAAKLVEVSFVAIGADGQTAAQIAANYHAENIEFQSWLQAKGWEAAALTDRQRVTLSATFEASQNETETLVDLDGNFISMFHECSTELKPLFCLGCYVRLVGTA